MNELFKKQKQLLQRLYSNFPNYWQPVGESPRNIGTVIKYIKDMQFNLNVEIQELIVAIGNGDDACFKTWKLRYSTIYEERFVFSEAVKKEAVDVLCFVLNICIAVGLTAENIEEAYNEVYENNLKRLAEGY